MESKALSDVGCKLADGRNAGFEEKPAAAESLGPQRFIKKVAIVEDQAKPNHITVIFLHDRIELQKAERDPRLLGTPYLSL